MATTPGKGRDASDGKGFENPDGKGRADGAVNECCCVCDDYVEEDQASSYAIAGYGDGFFVSCEDCTPEIILPAWDGVFSDNGNGQRDASFGTLPMYSIGGKQMNDAVVGYTGTPGACWMLEISCVSHMDIWSGFKAGGNTYAGVYTRTSGCDETETITLA